MKLTEQWVFAELAQIIGRIAVPFSRKYIVPAAKRVLEFSALEIAELVTGRMNFGTAAKNL